MVKERKRTVNGITEGVIWQQIMIFFFPILVGAFLQQLYNTADAMVVGRFVGPAALSAVGGTTNNILNLIIGFFIGLSSGATVIISQYFGGGDKEEINRAVHTAIALSLAGGLVLTVLGLATAPWMLRMLNVGEKLSEEVRATELVIGEGENSLDLQLWKNFGDEILVYIIAPDGTRFGPVSSEEKLSKYEYRNTNVYVYGGEPKPYSTAQEIFFQFISNGSVLDSGLWKIELVPIKITAGDYDMWLPVGNFINDSTGFVKNTPDTTLTIPSTAYNVISVGAYDATLNAYAAFSGRGYTKRITTVKPDLVAPGVGIVSTAVGGGYVAKTGTSMAAPFVTGSSALLMEWGIVKGNDPFMYGEKVKAYLIKGARPLPGETIPSPKIGWGALCLGGSLDE